MRFYALLFCVRSVGKTQATSLKLHWLYDQGVRLK
jgi:hypothetical protein